MTNISRSQRPGSGGRKSVAATGFALATVLAGVLVAVQPSQAQKETLLYSFRNGPDGIYPSSALIRDTAGNLYGETSYGGAFGAGTVFKLAKQGKTILYSFRGKSDGASPNSLFRDSLGNFYGTTSAGGDTACNNGSGCGTLFKLEATGKETVLHRFADSTTDGGYPAPGLVRDAKDNLYGATFLGGASNVGTVFKMDTAGTMTVLYSFTGGNGGPDGASPNGVIRDAAGNLYGSTVGGGPQSAGTVFTVFKVDAAGNETVLYAFTGGNGGTDGQNPVGRLVRDVAGNLYGATLIGGTANAGTIFKVDPTGKETVLHNFSRPGDGAYPQSSIARDTAGNLRGSTTLGGTYGDGVVFKYDTAGNETVLHCFGGIGDGQYPGDLTLSAAGHIYGATQKGGTAGWGTVFVIVP
jgi:uncharacterized repeat protein (TIGR03803 family)